MARPLYDRRRATRTEVRLPAGLKATFTAPDGSRRTVMTQLVDVSHSGIGVAARIELPADQPIEIRGDLHAEGLDLNLDATARVANCRPDGGGGYRVGLEFLEAAFARAS